MQWEKFAQLGSIIGSTSARLFIKPPSISYPPAWTKQKVFDLFGGDLIAKNYAYAVH